MMLVEAVASNHLSGVPGHARPSSPCHAGPIYIQEIQNTIMDTDGPAPGRYQTISRHNSVLCPV